MSDLEGLLEHIRDQPDDDVPRLVAADWYEEHGDTVRAGYIRDSIALERLPEWDRSPLEQRRLETILRQHQNRWLGEFRGMGKLSWERGFPSQLELGANRFLRDADRITRFVSGLILLRAGRSWNDLANCSALSRVRKLVLRSSASTPASLGRFLHSPHLRSLVELDLDRCGVAANHIANFASSEVLANLEIFHLDDHASGLAQLGELRSRKLRKFGLSFAPPEVAALEAIARSPILRQLTHLSLTNMLDEDSAVSLAAWPVLPQLAHLNLHFGGLSTVGARALATSNLLHNLKELRISFHEIGNQGVKALLDSPHLQHLESLDVGHSEGTAALGRLLAEWPGLLRLRNLGLYYNALGVAGVRALLQAPDLSALRRLDLSGCDLNLEALSLLCESPKLANLKQLTLWGNKLGPQAAPLLIRSPSLQNLEALVIQSHTFGKTGLVRLQKQFGKERILEW